jgi:tripartite ATP-independent transporter DctM subunit
MTALVQPYIPLLMFGALGVSLFSGLPVALVLTGVGFAFGLLGWVMGMVRLGDFGIIYHRIFYTLTDYDDVLWAAVPLVIFMGVMLEHSGIARELLLSLKLLLRRIPGGLAIAVTVIGIILAPSAGMVGASIATLALAALPAMLEQGYKPSFATGSIAAAGTLGVGLPPGLMLFFLAGAMGIQVPFIFLAMLGPALLIFLCYVAYFGVTAWFGLALSPEGMSARQEGSPGSVMHLFRSLVLPMGLVGVMLGSVVVGWATFAESAAFGAAGAVLMSLLRGNLSRQLLHHAIRQTVITTAMVFFIFVGATFFSMILRLVGGVEAVTAFLDGLHLGSWGTLTLVLAVIFVMGCFMDWVEIIVISFTIFRPVLDRLDFSGCTWGEAGGKSHPLTRGGSGAFREWLLCRLWARRAPCSSGSAATRCSTRSRSTATATSASRRSSAAWQRHLARRPKPRPSIDRRAAHAEIGAKGRPGQERPRAVRPQRIMRASGTAAACGRTPGKS